MKLLFFIVPSISMAIASAQAQQETSIKQQALVDGIDAALTKPSFRQRKERRALFDDAASMPMAALEMPADGIQGEKEPTPISSAFLSKFKKEHIELAKALYGATFDDEVLAEIVSAQEEVGINGGVLNPDGFEDVMDDYRPNSPVCDYLSEHKPIKSSKSGKGSKIELFTFDNAVDAGIQASATIYDELMYTPGIRNPSKFWDDNDYFGFVGDSSEELAAETIYDFFLLEDYLACAGTKIENVLTYKVYLVYGCSTDIFTVMLAFVVWWEEFALQDGDVLPTISFVVAADDTPSLLPPNLTPKKTKVMLEAVAAVF